MKDSARYAKIVEYEMEGADADAESIIGEVRAAFSNVPQGPITLHQAMANTWADEERVAAARCLDSDHHWVDISDSDIEHGAKALYGADPVSWRYFIPAFMVWTLRHFKSNDAFTVDQTIYTFDPRVENPKFHADNMERFRLLSQVQNRAVSRFLRYMSLQESDVDSKFALKALEKYWGQFCVG
jgi:hypothetical protein